MITLLIDKTVKELPWDAKYEKEGTTLLDVFQWEGISEVHSPCGGNGTCKKCSVEIARGEGERVTVLACRTAPEDGMMIYLKGETADTIATAGNCFIYAPDSTAREETYGVACDIGTTTVVCHLLELATGKRLATVSGMNAQKVFGADVIARITAVTDGNQEQLNQSIVGQINGMIEELCRKAGIEVTQVKRLAVVGNTVMEHLFANLNPESIGVAPFTPLSLFGDVLDAKTLGMIFDGEVYLAPCVAGYVGGDITSDMLAIQMKQSEETILMIDIGTNGEMALGSKDGIISCATAAGPAFEGAQITMGMSAKEGAISKVTLEDGNRILCSTIGNKPSIGICGSGLLDAVAVLLDLEIIDETGLFVDEDEIDDAFADRLVEEDDGMVFYLDENVKLAQSDIRKIQLAKAAIAAGILTMVKESGKPMSNVKRLILAGGFGSFLDPKSAARIGLIPSELLDVTTSVGNAAGEGAVSLVLASEAREEIAAITAMSKYIELSGSVTFNNYYMDCMYFEE